MIDPNEIRSNSLYSNKPKDDIKIPSCRSLPELEFCPERVQTEEWTDVGHHPGVHLAVTPEVRFCPETHLVRSRLVQDGEKLVLNGAGTFRVGPVHKEYRRTSSHECFICLFLSNLLLAFLSKT